MIDQSEKKLREDLLEKLIDNKLTGPTLQISFHCNPDQLPEKKLPHGNWASLYVLYRAYADVQGEEAAGKSVFYRVARKWKACLRFHKTIDAQRMQNMRYDQSPDCTVCCISAGQCSTVSNCLTGACINKTSLRTLPSKLCFQHSCFRTTRPSGKTGRYIG